MAKVYLQFQLPAERPEFELAYCGEKAVSALNEIASFLEDLNNWGRQDQDRLVQDINERFWQIVGSHGLEL